LVVAQLELNGKECGVCNFIVPIRDLKSGRLLPGVEIRDIGMFVCLQREKERERKRIYSKQTNKITNIIKVQKWEEMEPTMVGFVFPMLEFQEKICWQNLVLSLRM